MQMMALNSDIGYLCTLWEYSWKLHVYLIHKDIRVWNELKIMGWKAWQQVEMLKEKKNAVLQAQNIRTIPQSSPEAY